MKRNIFILLIVASILIIFSTLIFASGTIDEKEDYTKAIETYKQAIRIDPEDAYTYNNLGIAYRSLGLYKDAVEAYKQAIRIDPVNAIVYNNLGITYRSLGLYKDVETYKQAILIDPAYVNPHYGLGLSYLKVRDKKLALDEYKILKDLDINLANELLDLINK